MNGPRAFLIRGGDAPAFWQIGNLWRVMASGQQTGGGFCLLDQRVTADGGGPPSHIHAQDEGLYVVSGHCTFNAGGDTVAAPAGSFVAVPRRTEHSFTVDAPGTRLLNFYSPAGFDLILTGLAVPAERDALPPPGAVPLPPRRLVEQLSRTYGQSPVLGLPFADPPSPGAMATRPTPGATVRPFQSDAWNAPAYWQAGGLWSLLADAAATGGSYSLVEQLMPPGPQAAPHVHTGMDEVFYMLDGEAEFFLEDRVETAGAGALVFVPRGTVHAFRVLGDQPARALNLYTPAGFERTVTELAPRAEARGLPPPGWRPPDVPDERRTALFADIGMRSIALPAPWAA